MNMKTVIAAAILMAGTLPAAADDARKIDFTRVITSADGRPFEECAKVDANGKCQETVSTTLGSIAILALSAPQKPENGVSSSLSLKDQLTAGKLAFRIVGAKDAVLTSDDVTLIKDRIAKLGLNPIAVTRAISILDPADVK